MFARQANRATKTLVPDSRTCRTLPVADWLLVPPVIVQNTFLKTADFNNPTIRLHSRLMTDGFEHITTPLPNIKPFLFPLTAPHKRLSGAAPFTAVPTGETQGVASRFKRDGLHVKAEGHTPKSHQFFSSLRS